ncbi:MAG: hypothetical protein ACKOC6_00350, partial [bacterium]
TIIISRGRGYNGTNFGGSSAQGLPLIMAGYERLVPGVTQGDPADLEAGAAVVAAVARAGRAASRAAISTIVWAKRRRMGAPG